MPDFGRARNRRVTCTELPLSIRHWQERLFATGSLALLDFTVVQVRVRDTSTISTNTQWNPFCVLRKGRENRARERACSLWGKIPWSCCIVFCCRMGALMLNWGLWVRACMPNRGLIFIWVIVLCRGDTVVGLALLAVSGRIHLKLRRQASQS